MSDDIGNDGAILGNLDLFDPGSDRSGGWQTGCGG
jgi:hypothetical protein